MNRQKSVRSTESEQHILDVTCRLLQDVGPELSTEQVRIAANCSKGAIYHHFRSKRELVLRALQSFESRDEIPDRTLVRLLPLARRDRDVARLLMPARGGDSHAWLDEAAAMGGRIGAEVGHSRP